MLLEDRENFCGIGSAPTRMNSSELFKEDVESPWDNGGDDATGFCSNVLKGMAAATRGETNAILGLSFQ